MNSLPENRQQKILSLLQKTDTLSIHDLAEQLEVSQMTVHRDLNKLAEGGQVLKVHGGAKLTVPQPSASACGMCHQPISPRHVFILDCADRAQKSACCPHCGLMMHCGDSTPRIALATDFIYGHKTNALSAYYLVDSAVTLCCSPSVLTFADANDGERFQRGFGGKLMTYEQTQTYLRHAHIENRHS